MHIWVRAEERANERRTPLTPSGAGALIAAGYTVTVEENPDRCVPTADYKARGCDIRPAGSWRNAPADAIILGLKELPDDGSSLAHTHIMFGHAYKGQSGSDDFLARFAAGGGTLLDLEYLTDAGGRRLAAFGYWAGFAGAAVTLKAYAAASRGGKCGPVSVYDSASAMTDEVSRDLAGAAPRALVVGALGRVGNGVRDLCRRVGVTTTDWDLAETAHGGPFPEILNHDVFFNCILAMPGCPVFVPPDAATQPRNLTVVGDIACDPTSAYNPVPIYARPTTWDEPVIRIHGDPVLDVMAIDNLPSLLPLESSEDFASQLLPLLLCLNDPTDGVWSRARQTFDTHISQLERTAP